jgi:hypothetical protein
MSIKDSNEFGLGNPVVISNIFMNGNLMMAFTR